MIWLWHLFAALIAALVVASLVRPLSWLAHHHGWVFQHPPTARDVIVADVPFIGGLLALVGLFAANLVSTWPASAWGLTLGMFMVIAFGLTADLAVLPRWHRMAVLAAASLATVIGSDALIASTGPVFGPFEMSMAWIAIPISAVFVLFLAVAFRRVDRADGLCDGLALVVALGVLTVFALQSGQGVAQVAEQASDLGAVGLAAVGTLGALALFTWRHGLRRVASIYLSNGGSSIMGLLAAWLLLQAQGGLGEESIGLGALLWMVTIPVADTLFFWLRVVFTGSPESVQDKSRLQHLLQAKQFSMGQAVAIQLGIALGLTALAIVAWQAGFPDSLLFYGWLTGFAVYAWFAMTVWEGGVRKPSTSWIAAARSKAGSDWANAFAAASADTANAGTAGSSGVKSGWEFLRQAPQALKARAMESGDDAVGHDSRAQDAHAPDAPALDAPVPQAASSLRWSTGNAVPALALPRHLEQAPVERNDPLQPSAQPLAPVQLKWRTVAELQEMQDVLSRPIEKASFARSVEPQSAT